MRLASLLLNKSHLLRDWILQSVVAGMEAITSSTSDNLTDIPSLNLLMTPSVMRLNLWEYDTKCSK